MKDLLNSTMYIRNFVLYYQSLSAFDILGRASLNIDLNNKIIYNKLAAYFPLDEGIGKVAYNHAPVQFLYGT